MVDLSGGQEASAGSGEEGEQSYELKSEKGKIGLLKSVSAKADSAI